MNEYLLRERERILRLQCARAREAGDREKSELLQRQIDEIPAAMDRLRRARAAERLERQRRQLADEARALRRRRRR